MSTSRSFSQNMPDIDNLLKSPTPRRRASSPNITTNELEKLLRNSGNTPKRLPSPQFSLNLDSFFSPPRPVVPKANSLTCSKALTAGTEILWGG